MKNIIQGCWGLIVALTLALLFSGCGGPAAVPPPDAAQTRYILHAGGVTPEGVTGSSSLEALDHSYARGYRVMELDFCWTGDGELVCVHDWEAYYTRISRRKPPLLAEFEAARGSTYGFTSMTLAHLARWLEEHPDAVIVTDMKEDSVQGAALIAERYPALTDRLWLQLYEREEYDALRELGYDSIIWTLYKLPLEEKLDTEAIAAFVKDHQLIGLTFSVELLEGNPGYIEALSTAGVPLFVHTVNDPDMQEMLFQQGISGVYTDDPL